MTTIYLLDDIKVPDNRQRKAFPQTEEDKLVESILKYGLLHPLVVTEKDTPTLITGERRLRAIQRIYNENKLITFGNFSVPFGQFPCVVFDTLDPLTRKEIELEENTVRLDITWQEKARAIDELRELRIAQAKARGEEPDLKQIHAEILNVDTSKNKDPSSIIKDSEILAKHLHIPEVAKAKTKKEALKEVERIKKREAMHQRAEELEKIPSKHTVINSSFQTAHLESNFYDCVICDPPYGINASNFGSQPVVKHKYEDTPEVASTVFLDLLEASAEWTKPQAHMYVFCSIDQWPRLVALYESLILTPWKLWPRPLIWDKGNGILPRPEHGPRYTYEAIMFFSRGEKKVNGVFSDVLRYRVDLDLMHGAQKPVALYNDLLLRSCVVGDHVLDPTAGSGTIIPAADLNGCRATAIEQSEEYYKICLNRLATPDSPKELNIKEGFL